MAPISLVLPFALPAPEFAPDLVRALEAPALATLLSRHSSAHFHPLDAQARVLPHELFLARALGLAHGAAPRLATAAMDGHGIDPGDGTWFIVNPVHIQVSHSHLLMNDLRQLDLREDESRALFDDARAACADGGYELRYGAADTWFMRADAWDALTTASPEAAVGMNLTDWVPAGAPSRSFRKLQNELQVGWYTHPVNEAREARGQVPVNAIWPWGAASRASTEAARLLSRTRGATQPRPRLVTVACPGWLEAMAERRLDRPEELVAELVRLGGDDALLVVCGNAASAAIAADWAVWLDEMRRLEAVLFAPLLAALPDIKQLRLVLSHRDGHLDTTTTPMAQRKFWRRPTLEALR